MKFVLFLVIFGLFNQIQCSQQDNGDACLACKKFSNFFWNLTHNVDADLFRSLTKLCVDYSILPPEQAELSCNKSLDHFLDFINRRWNKDKICYDIKACNDGLDDGIRELTEYINDKTDCQFCIYVNTKIKELITGAPTEMEFKVHFEDMCHYLRTFENDCLSLVDDYLDTIFNFLKTNYVPRDICKSLRACPQSAGPLATDTPVLPSASELMNILPINISLDESAENRETPSCLICKKLVKIIQAQLSDNATDEQIIDALSEACRLLPRKDVDKCSKIVHDYINQLIHILSQDIDPDTACLLTGLCQSSMFNDYLNGNLIQRLSLTRNSFCVECELIAHYIQNEIYNYKNEAQIEEFIKNHLCKKMGFIMNPSNCQAFIDQYGPIILQTIAQEVFNPDMLCYQELHLCKKAKIHVIHPKSKEEEKCDICQKVIQNFSNITYSDLEINTLVQKGCQHVSPNLQSKCTEMVKSFASYFLDSLDRYENPRKICESVDICLTPGKVHLLGGHKCTYGPTYWCHSISHANACNAFKYCNEKSWNGNDN